MNKVFLGGTCNESIWRQQLIPLLKIDYFNPVVEDWTPKCQEIEEIEKNEICNIHLYVITPRMTGVFSIAEIIESSHNKNVTTIVYIQHTDDSKILEENGVIKKFDYGQLKSLDAVCRLAKKNGAIICESLEEVANKINNI